MCMKPLTSYLNSSSCLTYACGKSIATIRQLLTKLPLCWKCTNSRCALQHISIPTTITFSNAPTIFPERKKQQLYAPQQYIIITAITKKYAAQNDFLKFRDLLGFFCVPLHCVWDAGRGKHDLRKPYCITIKPYNNGKQINHHQWH